jgi:WD40 repeat protein
LTNPFKKFVVDNVFTGEGIMSLAVIDENEEGVQTIIGGSKRGNLEQFQWHAVDQFLTRKGEAVISLSQNAEKTIPYPTFSLLCKTVMGKQQVFCGGGDRFVQVLEATSNDDWQIVQKLGPHTGWVKALALDKPHNQSSYWLHSIGCNCIETWEWDESKTQWIHARKRSIESCPKQGSTLSSDLLCLTHWQSWICSGGVDGRIHVWSSDPKKVALQPLLSIAAHQGRVNGMVTLPLLGVGDGSCIVLTCGHDGELQCRRLNEDKERLPVLLEQPIARLRVLDEQGNPMRLSALACALKDDSTARVLLGTTTGVLVAVVLSVDNALSECRVMEEGRTQILDKNDAVSINAIVIPRVSQTEGCATIIGHSKGLSVVV